MSMSLANWAQVNKQSGSGNDTISVTANSNHTGRTARSTQMTVSAANVQSQVRTINQAGKPEFVTIQSTASVDKLGGTLTLSGKSNSSLLTFSLGSGATLALTLPASYIANSVSTNNGVAIAGDPGDSTEFDFSITFSNIPANVTVSDLLAQVIVTDNAGHTATCNVTQAAGDATLDVTPASVELAWDAYTEGTSATFTVTSNTNWTVS